MIRLTAPIPVYFSSKEIALLEFIFLSTKVQMSFAIELCNLSELISVTFTASRLNRSLFLYDFNNDVKNRLQFQCLRCKIFYYIKCINVLKDD